MPIRRCSPGPTGCPARRRTTRSNPRTSRAGSWVSKATSFRTAYRSTSPTTIRRPPTRSSTCPPTGPPEPRRWSLTRAACATGVSNSPRVSGPCRPRTGGGTSTSTGRRTGTNWSNWPRASTSGSSTPATPSAAKFSSTPIRAASWAASTATDSRRLPKGPSITTPTAGRSIARDSTSSTPRPETRCSTPRT